MDLVFVLHKGKSYCKRVSALLDKTIIHFNSRFQKLRHAIFSNDTVHQENISVATSYYDTRIVLRPNKLWSGYIPGGSTPINCALEIQNAEQAAIYPKQIKKDYKDSMLKVFKTCISYTEYLPLLLDEDIVEKVFSAGSHSSEISRCHNLDSLVKTYPLCARPKHLNEIELKQVVVDKLFVPPPDLLEAQWNNYNNPERSQVPINNNYDLHLQAHLRNMANGTTLQDLDTDIQLDMIIAVSPGRNRVPWLARVISQQLDMVECKWLHSVGKMYVYKPDVCDWISRSAVICSGVTMEPIMKENIMMWKLITPMEIIKAMNEEKLEFVQTGKFLRSLGQQNTWNVSKQQFTTFSQLTHYLNSNSNA